MEYSLLVLLTLSLLTACGSQKTRFGDNYSPAVGSEIADFAGNVSYTFTCDQFCDDGHGNVDQIITTWTLENFLSLGLVSVNEEDHPEFTISGTERNGSIPFPTFRNELTIVNLTRRLHNVRLYCGHSLDTTDGYWELRVYSAPILTSTHVAVVEGGAVSVDLSAGQTQAFPFPREFEWKRNGVALSNSSRTEFGYPQLNITAVTREDRGWYTLTATNSRLGDPREVVGTGNGSIQLQVYYGPEVESAGLSFIGAEDDNVSIVCGLQLRGDPAAIVQWRDGEGRLLDAPNSTFLFNNGPEVVDLMILGAKLSDSGNWTCTLTNTQTGIVLERILALTIISRPPMPDNVAVESVGASWLYIRWYSLLNISTNFTVRATPSLGGPTTSITVGRVLQTNVTGLVPGQEYIVTVTAVNSLEGITAISTSSYPVVAATNTSVPELVCLGAVSFNGLVNLSWEYRHTGGLNLTALAVDYTTHELAEFQNVDSDLSDTDRTTLEVEGLAAGELYTFRITASNEQGGAQALCPALWHSTGIPQTPVIHRATSNSPLEVVLTASTRASGTQPPDSSFQFIVRVRDNSSTLLLQMDMPYPDYQDGSEVALRVSSGLRGGVVLTFEVEAQNQYGSSPLSTAVQVTVREATTDHEQIPVAVVAGGAAGGAAVLILVVIVIVVTLCVCIMTSKKRSPGKLELSNSLEMVTNSNYGKFRTNFVDGSDELQPYEAIPMNLSHPSSQGSATLAPRTEKTSDNPLYSSTGELRMSSLFNAYDVLPPTRSRGHSPAFNGRQSAAPSLPPSTHTSITQYPLPSRPRSETLPNNSHLYAFPRHEHSPSHPTPNECGPIHSTTEADNGNHENRDPVYAVAKDPTVNNRQEPLYFEL